jgi:AraC-like DNA-binding protein
VDALSEVLRIISLDSAIYFNAELSEPWCFASPEAHTLAPIFVRGARHVIIFHFLAEGRAFVHLEGGERVSLRAGNIVSFPHGHSHWLGSGNDAVPIDVGSTLPHVLETGLDLVRVGGNGPRSRLICGFIACDPQLCQTFLGGLPPLITVNIRDDASGQWLENSLQFSVTEAARRQAGGTAVVAKLSEVVFAETLRRYLRKEPHGQSGWLAAAHDTEVGKALTLLHQRHAHPWTVAELAHEVGMSRTVLAERFRHFLGEPPIAYLTRWRLRLGARALETTSHSVAQIAAEAGYESEAAFNRAFKRAHGIPPARYRKERSMARSRDRQSAVTSQGGDTSPAAGHMKRWSSADGP